jgi:hypothetical protein
MDAKAIPASDLERTVAMIHCKRWKPELLMTIWDR